ncbi:MAG: regulatory protein, LuxR:Response regulator receiver [Anaerolineae bacterium]|jgi:DNA-binding NarL/FixJ family response regulator|nr:MAG: regulatory protein, LuxR:Response regulator receiver [Anaerolineae bacterium]
MNSYRILLADDHNLFREGLAGILNAQPDLTVVGQAVDGLEAYALALELRPDLIIMDIKMPLCDGLEAARLIHTEWSEARILMLTVHDEEEKLFEAIKAGACGYLLKNCNADDFIAGVRSALRDEGPLPPKLAFRLLQEFAHSSISLPHSTLSSESGLTDREQEVLRWLAEGATDKEIAQQMGLSIHTIKTHVRNILNKLHANNRRQASLRAEREGWLKKKGE